jgi:heme-degrading monooxygenase HmoA
MSVVKIVLSGSRWKAYFPRAIPMETAKTPTPPYYAVIFSSNRTGGDKGYGRMADRMVELAAKQPGYLGIESVRGADGSGITVSYWSSEEDIVRWKANLEHGAAQEGGRKVWYSDYTIRIARVERAYGMDPAAPSGDVDKGSRTSP